MTQLTSPPPATSQTPAPASESSGFNIKRIVMIATGVLIGLIVLIFVIALLMARGNVEQLGPIIEIVRDVVIIFIALEGVLIILALAVLILQIARLVNLLQTEVKPVLQNTKETMQSAKGTVDFVGNTVSGPLITASAFLAGVGAVVRDVGGIRRAVKKTAEQIDEKV